MDPTTQENDDPLSGIWPAGLDPADDDAGTDDNG